MRGIFANSKIYGDYRTGTETGRGCTVSPHDSRLTRRHPATCGTSASVLNFFKRSMSDMKLCCPGNVDAGLSLANRPATFYAGYKINPSP